MIRILIMTALAMELISRAFLQWRRRVAGNLAPFGKYPKQMFTLRTLLESGLLSTSEIAGLVHSDPPTELLLSLEHFNERDGAAEKRIHPTESACRSRSQCVERISSGQCQNCYGALARPRSIPEVASLGPNVPN
jgi:hypothetical protein